MTGKDQRMENTLAMPFAIGQQMWEPIYPPTQVKTKCPVCFGSLAVVVILGNGERVGVPCEACGISYDGPRGYIEEWEYQIGARPFVIASVQSMNGGDWVVVNDVGWTYSYANLCATEEDAIQRSREHIESLMERQAEGRRHRRASVKKAAWSIRYHRKQIADLERRLLWHRSKVESASSSDARLMDSESGTASGSATNSSTEPS